MPIDLLLPDLCVYTSNLHEAICLLFSPSPSHFPLPAACVLILYFDWQKLNFFIPLLAHNSWHLIHSFIQLFRAKYLLDCSPACVALTTASLFTFLLTNPSLFYCLLPNHHQYLHTSFFSLRSLLLLSIDLTRNDTQTVALHVIICFHLLFNSTANSQFAIRNSQLTTHLIRILTLLQRCW